MKFKNISKITITILFILLSFNINVRAEALENEYQTFYSEGVKLEIVSKAITKDKLKLKCRVSNMTDSEVSILGNKFYILDEEKNDLDIKMGKNLNIESFILNQISVKPNQVKTFKITLANINNKEIYTLKGQIKKYYDYTKSATADVDIQFNLNEEV